MKAEKFLSYLEELDVRLWINDGKLRCSAPKGILTPELRKNIAELKPELLILLAKKPADNDLKNLPLISREGELPLSFSQERIWALNRVDPASNVTGNIYFTFRITGSLDVASFEKGINELIQRHEVFRTGCKTVNEHPVQSIIPRIQFNLPVNDLREFSLFQKESTVLQVSKQYAIEPFNLAEVPILRSELLRTGDEEYIFLLATHLYVFDGWSSAILFKEISSLYADFYAGKPSRLPELTAQYVDFAQWHRNWLKGEVLEKQNSYWKDKLKGACLVRNLPLDRPRKAIPGNKSASVYFTVPDFLAESVRKLSQKEGATLFITLMAAFQSLLYRYTNQDNITIGTIVSNRKVAETEMMIGSFANNILISSDFYSDITCKELIYQVRKTSQEAYSHQDIPFEMLLGELDEGLNRTPLFRVMFLFHQHQSIENQGFELSGLKVEKCPVEKGISKYELNLVMTDFNETLSGYFEYSTDIFDHSTIERMKENFLVILKKVTVNPDISLSELPYFIEDRQSFTELGADYGTKTEYTAPRTQIESTIAEIWQKLFKIDKIGIHDSFLDLGGHSLLAAKMISRIEDKFESKMMIKSIFEFPTIAEFAQLVETKSSTMERRL
ncbi:MAG: hypothetical protein DRR19_10200 [Candidatus Parabeggiatoa sp. nov. 1]|nr:MAG: hypothetical protein DRR19_10200 [Gammaproteobacteria bacterium]